MSDLGFFLFMSALLVMAFVVLTGGAPLLILAAWLDAQGKHRQTLADARLLEAQNEAKRLAQTEG